MHFPRNRRRASNDEAILPLTNVVFLLLIFFMLAGRLVTPEPFDIALPESHSESSARADGLEIQLAADGRLALDGETIALDDLVEAVRARLEARPGTPVRLRADGTGDATRVVAIMRRLHDAGAERLRLITVARQR